jgi:dolichyl-phosphate-mannose-protein mannosyltransferase
VSRVFRERPAAWRVVLGAAWLAAAAWVAVRLDQGWVPHDDGSFAQSAQRVLDGQLPHREFAELYTGGLTFLNAAVFAVLGEDLFWLRLPMFALFLAYVPCFYAICRRFVDPPVALLATAFAVVWSVPVYPAAVPSWYLLFFSVFGTYCVIRHFETGRLEWLLAAGLFGGLAIAFKIVGIWLVVAVLVCLVVAAQGEGADAEGRRLRFGAWGLVVAAAAVGALGLVVGVLRPHLSGAELANLLVPVAALCAVPVVAGRRSSGAAGVRLRALGRRVLPFCLGVALPVAAVAVPYLATGAVGDLLDGVFVAPRSRLDYSYEPLPGAASLLWALPVVAALVVRQRVPAARRAVDAAGVVVAAALVVTAGVDRSYLLLWHAARALAPVVVVAGALLLAFRPGLVADAGRRLALLLVLLVAGFGSLVQFPFGAPVYFCYAAPLFALAAVGLVSSTGLGGGMLPVALLGAYVAFGLLYLDRSSIATLGIEYRRDPQTVILDPDLASIRVSPSDRDTYRRAAALLELHGSGEYVFAGPDAPELYVLSRRENPTRALFDFVDTSDSARGARLVRTLRERGVTAIAINGRPDFSDPLDAATVRRLQALYPKHAEVGKFDVRWR